MSTFFQPDFQSSPVFPFLLFAFMTVKRRCWSQCTPGWVFVPSPPGIQGLSPVEIRPNQSCHKFLCAHLTISSHAWIPTSPHALQILGILVLPHLTSWRPASLFPERTLTYTPVSFFARVNKYHVGRSYILLAFHPLSPSYSSSSDC